MEQQPNFPGRLKHTFSIQEKVALVFLIVAGMSGLFFGVKYLGKNLNAPFVFNYNGPQYLTPSQQEQQNIDKLKSEDTDGDGLSDYDETYVYHTSPYLKDSDSDGIDDPTEIKNGTDPNCPEGKTCNQGPASNSAQGNTSGDLLTNVQAPTLDANTAALINASASGNVTPTTGQMDAATAAQLSAMTPAQLRGLLISSGMDQTQLSKISDADLMKMYQQTLTQYQTSSAANTSTNTTTP